jgi:PAS domain S-box-containing protein
VRKEQAMVENANDIICSLDAQRQFLRANKAVLEILGYTPQEMCGKKVEEFLPPQDAASSIKSLDAIISSKSTANLEIVMMHKDGTSRVLLWTATWSEIENALFCVLHDITERKRVERNKQDFVAMVTHDLRSPLMAIQATHEMLEDSCFGELSPQGRNSVSSAQRNLYFLLSFIDGILNIEKMESGRFELDKQSAPVQKAIERAGELVAELAVSRRIKLTIGSTDKDAYYDFDRVVQVILNLLSNALKYSPKDSEVKLEVSQKQDDLLEIRISDSGPGIPAAMHEAIFDRFQQSSSADWKEKKGFGLGLAICKSMIEAHGGKIGVESTVGHGSTFWFTLPIGPPPVNEKRKSVILS